MSRIALCGAVLVAAAMAACAPALNWREVQPDQAEGLRAMFPCKPDAHERQVPWPGLPQGVTMHVLSCQTDDSTWALSYLTLPDVALVGPSMQEMTALMQRNLAAASQLASGQAVTTEDQGPVNVPRMTPSSQAHAWRFGAQRPDGWGRPMSLDIRTWHFSHGMTVFQGSVWRPVDAVKGQSSEDVADTFFRGFHFPG